MSGMPAISKPQAQTRYLLTSQSIIFPARLQSLPLLEKKSSVPASDPTGLSGPLKPLSLAPYSFSSLIWQPQSDLPFLFLNSASMLPPACQYLTTLSSYITSPTLNPSPSRARGCACSIQFNSAKLYWVPSIHSFQHLLSACCIRHWGSRIKRSDPRSRVGERDKTPWYVLWCWISECKAVSYTRLAAKRWSEWDQRIPKDDDTQSDISNGPRQSWEDTRRMNTWPLSSTSLNSIQRALSLYRLLTYLHKHPRPSAEY